MNEDDVYIWLNQVIEPSSVIELRILNAVENPRYPPFTLSGYFDCSHLDTLVRSAMEWTHKAEGIYVTINPVNPALLARAYNRVVRKPKNTTTDADIARRVGLVFDADPVRPAGISATAEEKALARERIDCLMVGLTRRGWPYPILADSGNGFHARYRVDLPTADVGLVSRVLKAADVLFSDKRVKIDTSLSNASRIVKLYGTMSRKGDDTPDRPHRWSQMLFFHADPDDFRVVPVELLEALAAEVGTVVPAGKPPGAVQADNQVPRPGRPLSHDRRSPASRARAYVFAPGFPDSVAGEHGHRQLYRAAACLVDGFGLTFEQALPIFQDWNQERAHPPEDEKHVRRTLNDAIGNNPVPSLKLLRADRHAHS